MLDEERFWGLIAESRARVDRSRVTNGDEFHARQCERLSELLRALAAQELIDYQKRFDALMRQAYRWDLWGAAYWLHGGCSDDGFADVRASLISLGQERYYQALGDPDALAEIEGGADVPYLQGEGFAYLAGKVYREKTGAEMPAWETEPLGRPMGERYDFDDEDEAERRLPKLYAKYPEMGD